MLKTKACIIFFSGCKHKGYALRVYTIKWIRNAITPPRNSTISHSNFYFQFNFLYKSIHKRLYIFHNVHVYRILRTLILTWKMATKTTTTNPPNITKICIYTCTHKMLASIASENLRVICALGAYDKEIPHLIP